MEKITNTRDLKIAIHQMESRQKESWEALGSQYRETAERLKPLNFIKGYFNEKLTSSGIKDGLLSTIVGLATGYLSKTLIVGASHNPVKKMAGSLLQFGISNVVSKNPETVRFLIDSIGGLLKTKDPEIKTRSELI